MNFIKALPLFIASLNLQLIKANPVTEFSSYDDCWSACEDKCGEDIVCLEECHDESCKKLMIDPRDKEHIQLYAKAARIAHGVYFADKKNGKEHNCEDGDGSQYRFCKTNEAGETSARVNAVAIIKKDDICYVAFRGTRANEVKGGGGSFFEDIMTNLDTDRVSFPSEASEKCEVFAGFAEAYTDMQDFIIWELPKCKEMCDNGPCSVVLTGHSQGGAAAVAASLDDFMTDLFDDPFVITFGAPPVLNDIEENGCESLINRDKHFRLVTAKAIDGDLICDPITEHTKKRYDINGYYGDMEIDGTGMEDGIHIGHTVLLKGIEKIEGKDLEGSGLEVEWLSDVVIATADGDHTCIPFEDTDQVQTLTEWDFHQAGAKSYINKFMPIPLHNIKQAYRLILNAAATNSIGYEKGFKFGQSCTQDWQCDGGTCFFNQCQVKIENTVFYPTTGKILVEYAHDFDFFEKMVLRVPVVSGFGKLKWENKGDVENRIVRIVNAQNVLKPKVIECLEDPRTTNDFTFSPLVNVDYRKKVPDGLKSWGKVKYQKIGNSVVRLEFGEGSCDNFTKRSEDEIKFSDDSPYDAVIELKRIM